MRAVFLACIAFGAWSLEAVSPDEVDDGLSLLQFSARKTSDAVDDLYDAPRGNLCRSGVRGGRYCCGANCGQCGGRGCQNRPGGGNKCCTNQIRRSARRCTGPNMDGCLIPRRRNRNRGNGNGGNSEAPEPPVPPLDINDAELVEELGLCENSMSLENVLHSNLGGAGPDSGSADLTYASVFPGTNLVITATSPYTPNSLNPAGGVIRNGARNGFGVINMASGSFVDLTFKLQDAATGQPKVVDTFAFTLVDGDHGQSHESRESFTVNGFTSYAQDVESTLTVENAVDDDETCAAGNGRATFVSTLRGSKQDNPESALALTRLQSRRSVTFLFESKSEFTVTAAERNYANPQGRNIFFTGASNLVCPREATCATYQCPRRPRMRQRQNAEFLVCASRPCTDADQDTCCVRN